jgi:glucose/arabinose dehydrogenase
VLTPYKEMEGITNPVRYWVPSIGPCGMMLATTDKYPGWNGKLLIGALRL